MKAIFFVFLVLCGFTFAQRPDDWTPPPKDDDWTPPEGGFSPPDGWTPPPNPNGDGGNGGAGGAGTCDPPAEDEPEETPEVTEKPTEPAKCSDANMGRCDCGDESQGFTTYTFWQDDVQRCFTVFIPNERANEVLPVVFGPNCYASDVLMSIDGTKADSDGNLAAARYGYAKIGISSPNGHWEFGNNGVVNDDKPMPCSDEDSVDIAYVRTIIQWLESQPEQFDASRMYSVGFSQNSMFSAYIGFCFPEQVRGVFQAGSGMALTGLEPNLPGCQGQVTASQYVECGLTCTKCQQCLEAYPCEDCQYWPIYPCYNSQRPMIDCLIEYDNDAISVGKQDKEASSARYMYEKLVNEGHDARLFRFSPSSDGTIAGNHQDLKNNPFWQVGCLGITDSCSQACEDAFVGCVSDQGASTALEQTEAFAACMEPSTFEGLGCAVDCAPTFNMLAESEAPTEVSYDNFGAGPETASAQPASSLCSN